jgi:hypothetical protein
MSDNDDENGKINAVVSPEKAEKIKRIISGEDEVEGLKQELANVTSEKEQLEGDLTTIAEQRLNEKTRQYKINPELSDEEKISRIKEIEGKSINDKDERSFWNNKNATYKIENDEGYDSVEDLILDLEKHKKQGGAIGAEAEAVLNQLAKKALAKPFNFELESPLRTMARRPRMLETEKQVDYQQRLDDWKKTQKWKHIGDE